MKPYSLLLFFILCISTMLAHANAALKVLQHFDSHALSLIEVLHYGYTTGGLLKSVVGVKPKGQNIYLWDRTYDEQGRKTYQRVGNGVSTEYTYSPTRQWLRSMHTELPSGDVLQEIRYGHDPVGNIIGIRQTADVYHSFQLGGMYENRYTYDKQYRLIEAIGTGDFSFSGKASYSSIGKMGEKHLTSNKLNGDLTFGYDSKSLHHYPQLV